jgi:hypothetical protein
LPPPPPLPPLDEPPPPHAIAHNTSTDNAMESKSNFFMLSGKARAVPRKTIEFTFVYSSSRSMDYGGRKPVTVYWNLYFAR